MSDTVSHWLETLGLPQYAAPFLDNHIELDLLPDLDHDTLLALGVVSAGHRLRILKAAKTSAPAVAGALQAGVAAHDVMAAAAPGSQVVVPAHVPTGDAAAAERRQLTVMFCDLVGSTDLSGHLDPEVLREVVLAYQHCAGRVIAQFEGHIAQYLGDGLLVYFGYPQAHEDDAARAVHAGLGITQALIALNRRLLVQHAVALRVRIGIHTGPVVVGEMGNTLHRENLAMGETPNLAARLQGLAEPDAVVISEQTLRLLGQRFDVIALGAQNLKGIAAPVKAFAVTNERVVETRFAGSHMAGAPAMVGREQELALLMNRWRSACSGEGQVVVVSGEAGIGKSCLGGAMIEALGEQDHERVSYQCSPYHVGTALHPVVAQLLFAAGFAADDSPGARLDKLERWLELKWAGRTDSAASEVALLAGLIGLGELAEARHGLLTLTANQRRERSMQLLVEQLIAMSQRRPLLIVLEDAHWIDPTTLALIDRLLEHTEAQRMLLLVTARPGFVHAMGARANVLRLALSRMGRESVDNLALRVTQGKALPRALLDDIAAKTDGVPLFVEELTKGLLESGQLRDTGHEFEFDGRLDTLSIPSSLQDALMARLDRMQHVKELAQTAACIGREFTHATLAALSALSPEQLDSALEQLVKAEIIFARGAPSQRSYSFKHALVRDAAHESLLMVRRRAIHGQLLRHLRSLGQVAPQVMAHHAEQSDAFAEAIELRDEAGSLALSRSAFVEATGHFERALESLRAAASWTHLSPSGTPLVADATERTLQLELKLAHACAAGHGHGSLLAANAFARAKTLADAQVASPLRFAAYYGSSLVHVVRSELGAAHAMADNMFLDALQNQDEVHRMMAYQCRALATLLQGDFAAAIDDYEHALALSDALSPANLIKRFGHEPRGVARCYHALALWCVGQSQRSAELWQLGMDLAQASGHAPSKAQPLVMGALLAWLSGTDSEHELRVNAAIAFTQQQGLPMWRGFALALQAAGETKTRGAEQALATLANAQRQLDRVSAYFLRPLVSTIEAQALSAAGQPGRAEKVLLEAQQHQDKSGERWMAAEVWRVLGQVRRTADNQGRETAAAAYRQAVAVAQSQGAKAWTLRAERSFAALSTP